jgi:hypothetical protein
MERAFEPWPEATQLPTIAELPATLERATRLVNRR